MASYRLPAATGSGYALLGSPTVIANLTATGAFPLIAERLWDVDPSTNTETLVARGVYRLDPARPDGVQVFQLHPGAWHFAAGHIPKLELLGQDTPYSRISNGVFSIALSGLQLRLPVHEKPAGAGTPPVVGKPKPPVKGHPQSKPPACVARPSSAITRRSVHASRRGLRLRGSAGEKRCPQDRAATRRGEHVARVYVSVYRIVRGGRCRFLLPSGRLSAARSCGRPVEFLARGTAQWSLRLSQHVPAGRYVIRPDAFDRLHHAQRSSAASVVRVNVR